MLIFKQFNNKYMNQNDVTEVDNGQDLPIEKKRFNPKIVAAIVGGVVLASTTGGVIYAMNVEGEPVDMGTQYNTGESSFWSGNGNTPEPPASVASTSPTGTPFNIHTAPHAHNVNDSMSFDQAFATARQETGAGGVFTWKGQLYGTFYATEVDASGNPIINYPKVDNYVNNNGNVASNLYTNENTLTEPIVDHGLNNNNNNENENASEGGVVNENNNNNVDELNEVQDLTNQDLNALNDNFTDLQDYVG